MNVLHFHFGARNVSDLDITGAFHPPYQHPALGISEPRKSLWPGCGDRLYEAPFRFARRIGTLKVEEQFFRLRVDNIFVNRFLSGNKSVLKNILGARHGLPSVACYLFPDSIAGKS